jgi:hypothetical protein
MQANRFGDLGAEPGRQEYVAACFVFIVHALFGGVVAQLKYASLVANAVMLSNVADLTEVLCDMPNDGHHVTADLVACISPYLREHIRRFGRFSLDMADLPNPLNPQPLPFEVAL